MASLGPFKRIKGLLCELGEYLITGIDAGLVYDAVDPCGPTTGEFDGNITLKIRSLGGDQYIQSDVIGTPTVEYLFANFEGIVYLNDACVSWDLAGCGTSQGSGEVTIVNWPAGSTIENGLIEYRFAMQYVNLYGGFPFYLDGINVSVTTLGLDGGDKTTHFSDMGVINGQTLVYNP